MRVDGGLGPRQDGDAPVALTIGNFDGVHLGHAALLAETRAQAAAVGGQSALLTFDPHPRCVLDPAHCPQSLTTVGEKQAVLADAGLDRLVVLPFTRAVSAWGAEQFCDMLRDAFDLRALVVGHDFALGHKRQGDISFLRDYGERHGLAVVVVDVVDVDGVVSSSRIRSLVSDGDVRGAATLLGRSYFMDAVVEHGEEVGRHLGFPTANLSIAAEKCLPAPGVYAMWVRVDGGVWHAAATNVGYRPTFGGDRLTVEAYLLDFTGDLYGREVRAVFVDRLREERRYESVDELVVQIGRDVEQVRALMVREAPPLAE